LVSEVARLANSPHVLAVARRRLLDPPSLVRAIYFDKSPENNWFVSWHQDKTVTVSDRIDLPGWGPWSVKAGAWHVQPPLEVLERMVTVRIHLDPATKDNGCLKVVPGTHSLGLIPDAEVHELVEEGPIVFCEAPAGGAVVMRPLILHASERAVVREPRRVLHLEYTDYALPDGMSWSG
jgi:ectoine hydroxylase-related dioxygenase (phytanoyl-CoA dioxygenase family)